MNIEFIETNLEFIESFSELQDTSEASIETHNRTISSFIGVAKELELNPSVKLKTLTLYKRYTSSDFSDVRITNHVVLIALCLLKAVRETSTDVPLTFSEIIQAFRNNHHRVTNKNILRLARQLDIDLSPTSRKAEDYISRVVGSLSTSSRIKKSIAERGIEFELYQLIIENIAHEFLSKLDRTDRGGVQPFPLAISIVYLADRCYNRAIRRTPILTQKLMAETTGGSQFTIRDHMYRFLKDIYDTLEPELITYVNILLQEISVADIE